MRDGDPVPVLRARNQPGERSANRLSILLWPPLSGLLPATSWSLCPVSVGCSSFAVTSLTMPTVWTWTMSGQSGCCGSTGHKIVHCCLWQTRAHCAVVKQKTLLWQCSLRHTQQIPIHRHQQRQRQTDREKERTGVHGLAPSTSPKFAVFLSKLRSSTLANQASSVPKRKYHFET